MKKIITIYEKKIIIEIKPMIKNKGHAFTLIDITNPDTITSI